MFLVMTLFIISHIIAICMYRAGKTTLVRHTLLFYHHFAGKECSDVYLLKPSHVESAVDVLPGQPLADIVCNARFVVVSSPYINNPNPVKSFNVKTDFNLHVTTCFGMALTCKLTLP
jgi:hypothetical protein